MAKRMIKDVDKSEVVGPHLIQSPVFGPISPRELMPVFEKYKVDAVLTAHLHTYRRRVPLKNFAPAADGITYILTGVAGDVRYPKLWGDFEWDAARAPQPETTNYMTLKADADSLELKAFLANGKQFDEVRLTK